MTMVTYHVNKLSVLRRGDSGPDLIRAIGRHGWVADRAWATVDFVKLLEREEEIHGGRITNLQVLD